MPVPIREGYYYLHINGQLVFKAPAVVNPLGAHDFFDSDMVVKYWYVKTTDDHNEMLIELSKLRQELKNAKDQKEKRKEKVKTGPEGTPGSD